MRNAGRLIAGRAAGVLAALAVLGAAAPAQAYVGPGAGISLLGAVAGLAVALFAAVGMLLMWPIRQALARRRRARAGNAAADSGPAE